MVAFKERDTVQKYLKEAGVASAIYYPQPLHLANPCRDLGYQAGDFPVAERFSAELLALPIFPELEEIQQRFVVDTIRDFLNQ